jgi:hypothetical protein
LILSVVDFIWSQNLDFAHSGSLSFVYFVYFAVKIVP